MEQFWHTELLEIMEEQYLLEIVNQQVYTYLHICKATIDPYLIKG